MKHQSLNKIKASRGYEQGNDKHEQVLTDETLDDNILVNRQYQIPFSLYRQTTRPPDSVLMAQFNREEEQRRRHARKSTKPPQKRQTAKEILKPIITEEYNKNLMPGDGHKPVNVEVSLQIKNSGRYNEETGSFPLEVYVRQIWNDSRLVHGELHDVRGSGDILDYIWEPDTVVAFVNTTKVKIANMFVNIEPNGEIRARNAETLETNLVCEKRSTFPTTCRLFIRSLTYLNTEVDYNWSYYCGSPIQIADNSFPKAPYDIDYRYNVLGKVNSSLMLQFRIKKKQE